MNIAQKFRDSKCSGIAKWLIVFFFLISILTMAFWEPAMQHILLKKMLSSDGYALNNDAATNKRLIAILPKLQEIHKAAVVASKGKVPIQEHLQDLEAFNTRISAWSALCIILKDQHNQTGIDYIESFIRSSQALPEEIAGIKGVRANY